MSEEWKSERAEVEMRQGTDAIMKAAQEKAKHEEEKKWDKMGQIDFVIELLKDKYELPELKE